MTNRKGHDDALTRQIDLLAMVQSAVLARREREDPGWTAVSRTLPPTSTDREDVGNEALAANAETSRTGQSEDFIPLAPSSIRDTGLRESQIEALALKYLLNAGVASGREIANQMSLPFGMVDGLLHHMKYNHLLAVKSDSPPNDFVYELTGPGTDRARRHMEQSTYFGAAPVTLSAYLSSVKAQSVAGEHPSIDGVRRAFSDLLLSHEVLEQLGESMNLGLGLFLYGKPGNGKTEVSRRLVNAYSPTIWLPRAISVGGEIIRVFDPLHHQESTSQEGHDHLARIDKRWVRIRRPTVMVGAELTLSDFDLKLNERTGVSEAPLQVKSNCGTLVVDDFGRQQFPPEALLNRLIVPLETRYDELRLKGGRLLKLPFEPMIVFATNLDPMDLADEAFLRRIPYAIRLPNPSEAQFRKLFERTAERMGVQVDPGVVDILVNTHLHECGREMRFCQPRDVLVRVRNSCQYRGTSPRATKESVDAAVGNSLAFEATACASKASQPRGSV